MQIRTFASPGVPNMTKPIQEKLMTPKELKSSIQTAKKILRLPVTRYTPGPREKPVAIVVTTPSLHTKFFQKGNIQNQSNNQGERERG